MLDKFFLLGLEGKFASFTTLVYNYVKLGFAVLTTESEHASSYDISTFAFRLLVQISDR
jgi:hypothetical protein